MCIPTYSQVDSLAAVRDRTAFGPGTCHRRFRPSTYAMQWRAVLCAALLLIASPLLAQQAHDEQDPFLRRYVLGNDAEILLVRENGLEIYDYTGTAPSIVNGAGGLPSTARDVISGDFDGQPEDEIATASSFLHWDMISPFSWDAVERIVIQIGKQNPEGILERTTTIVRTSTHRFVLPLALHPQVRVLAGNFDRSGQQQLLVAYTLIESVWLSLFRIDSAYRCVEVATCEAPVTVPLDLANPNRERFNVTAGDFDGDGLDEAMLMTADGVPHPVSGGTQYGFHALAYDFDYHQEQFVCRIDSVFTDAYAESGDSLAIDRLALCAADLNLDRRDEVVYGYDLRMRKTLWYGGASIHHWTFAEPIDFDPSFSKIVINHGKRITVENWNGTASGGIFFGIPNLPLTVGLAAKDLNLDGRDEVIIRGGRILAIYSSDNVLTLTRRAAVTSFSAYDFVTTRLIATADMNADTASTDWSPEIAVVAFQNEPNDQIYPGPGNAYLDVYKATLDASHTITGMSRTGQLQLGTYGAGTDLGDWSLATGDFDGNAIRLGIPRRATKERMLQPIVVLNAPPTHFDILNGTEYDINKCYNGNTPTLYARYETSTDSTMIVETAMNADWGVSAELSYGGSFLGIGVKANLGFQYGEGFARDSTRSHKLSFAISTDAVYDDEVYVTETNYNLFEYPVYYRGNVMGHVLVASPHLQEKNWYSAKDLTSASGYTPMHEIGNILSYPTYYPFSTNPAFADTIMMASAGLSLDQNPNKNWSVSITDFGAAGAKKSHTIGTSVGASVSGWGFEASVKSHYDKSEISTLRTEVMDQFGMRVHYDGIDRLIGEVNYNVTPYIYWATNGALVLDYNVSINPVANPWWDARYGQAPDMGFILPWRYDPEKGLPLQDESKRQRTSDIVFRPSSAEPGDTILIVTQIHNFSLLACTAPIQVRFYLGDPGLGGTPIVGIDGDSVLTEYSTLDAQGTTEFLLEWVVPLSVPVNPRIYAVIDRENAIAEVHEDNNVGYSILKVAGVVAVDELPSEAMPKSFSLEQNYPNPFNPATVLSYAIGHMSPVSLKVYDVLGREVSTLVNEVKPAGRYTVPFNAGGLASGIYYATLRADRFVMTKKLVLLR